MTSLLRRLGRTRAFARLGRATSRLDRRIQRATDGRWSVLGRPTLPQLVLTTTGRRSGEPRDAVLLYVRDGGDYVVIGSNWGQQHHPAWSLNLLADPRARVSVGGRTLDVVARLATDDDRTRLLDSLRAVWPGYDDYATRSAALPVNEQTVARDLNRRDLKLTPPDDLKGPELRQWMQTKPMELEVDGRMLTGEELVKWKYQRYMQDYLACVQGVDDGVGRVLDYLDESGLAKNTIVLYSADNGWYLGDLGLYDKRFMYEPGLRVPLLAKGPGIEAGIAPEAFVANIDLAPTFLDLVGLPVPDSMQGRSFAPLLRGETPSDWRTSVYYRYYHDPGHHNTAAHYGVRTATHKLIHYWKQDAYELFDLVADPTEQHNLLHSSEEAQRPEIAAKFAELKDELARLQQEYEDDGRYADPATWPQDKADGPFDAYQPTGVKTVAEAILAAGE